MVKKVTPRDSVPLDDVLWYVNAPPEEMRLWMQQYGIDQIPDREWTVHDFEILERAAQALARGASREAQQPQYP
ncbi:MAG: hypothetical protein AAB734_02560 [Patescibacteria group bacterium]